MLLWWVTFGNTSYGPNWKWGKLPLFTFFSESRPCSSVSPVHISLTFRAIHLLSPRKDHRVRWTHWAALALYIYTTKYPNHSLLADYEGMPQPAGYFNKVTRMHRFTLDITFPQYCLVTCMSRLCIHAQIRIHAMEYWIELKKLSACEYQSLPVKIQSGYGGSCATQRILIVYTAYTNQHRPKKTGCSLPARLDSSYLP